MGADGLRLAMASYRDAVARHATRLDRLNVYPVPDGDTGTNMARTLDAVVAEIELAEPALAPTCDAISHGSLMGARGNSGVILSQLLRGMTQVLRSAAELDGDTLARALREAAAAAYEAVLRPVEGTILTVARESGAAAERAAARGASLVEVVDEAHRAGREALERTPDLLPALKSAGVVDAGGAGYVLFLDALLHVIDGRPLPDPGVVDDQPAPPPAGAPSHADGPRYEVMYLLDLPDDRIDTFKVAWGELGDSIVVVGGGGQWSCHVHTDQIGPAVETAISLGGRPHRIQVTDLHEQAAAEHDSRVAAMRRDAELPPVASAVVAVAAGPGLASLMEQLGAQAVVAGGQTMNPSTAELLAAIDAVNSHEVVLLPNNPNIVPVAEQVPELTDREVVVLPTRSMPEGLAALVAYRADRDASQNAVAMRAAAEAVLTGEVTRAVRDSGEVRAGQWIGLRRGEGIAVVAATAEEAAIALLAALVGHDHELLTIIEGADATPAVTAAVLSWLRQHHPGLEVEVHAGGQHHYPYLLGLE